MEQDDAQHQGSKLELRNEGEGLRYYLAGAGVHAGDIMEMLSDDGTWQCVRYEHSWDRKTQTLNAFLFLHEDQYLSLSPSARFRWLHSSRPRF